MMTHFSEKERAFVEGLAAESGRDLAAWMSAIGASGRTGRNDIIDWLRQEGFTFANASWLERIHHNGGRLIYAGSTRPAAAAGKPHPAGSPTKPAPGHRTPPSADAGIDTLLAAAKAYRPLAQVLLRDILAAVPGADAVAHGGLIVISHAHPFAAVAPSPKEVRLLLAAALPAPGTPWQRAKPTAGLDIPPALTHVLVLTDARQLTAELKALVVASATARLS